MKKRILALLVAVIMLLSLAACGKDTKTPTDAEVTSAENAESAGNEESAKAPEKVEASPVFGNFNSVDVDGNKVSSEILKGKKVTMVNIWGTFCTPCIKEMPDLEKLNKEYADKGFQVVGIVCDVAVYGNCSF